MSLQTPPQQEKGKAGVSGADEKVNDSGIAVQPTAASVDGAPGDKKEGSSEKSKRLVVGVKDPVEQDVMWKLKVRTALCAGAVSTRKNYSFFIEVLGLPPSGSSDSCRVRPVV